MFQNILERNKVYIQNQKLYFPLDQEVIRAVHILNEQKIFTLSGLRHTGKTKLVHALLKKTQSFDQCFYFNGDIDTLGGIKNEKDMITLLDIFVRMYGIPKIIVLQNCSTIAGIKSFIAQLYKTKKYKLIIVGNNIKIEGVQDIELFPQ
jgi:predicted AAA+ superfamily ATPase